MGANASTVDSWLRKDFDAVGILFLKSKKNQKPKRLENVTMPNARQSWPYNGAATSPAALTQTPDGLLNSDRSLAGPLRRGTSGNVGPVARALGGNVVRGESDFGMDRRHRTDIDAAGRLRGKKRQRV